MGPYPGWLAGRVSDPWIALAAMAVATSRILLGPIVTPLYRRHPWKLARETVTLDHLSGGRVVLGVGLGDDVFGEIRTFDGPMDPRTRAEMMDEGLAVLLGLWSGEKFSFEGKHFTVRDAQFLPVPLQEPRIPIWVAGTWPRKPPFRRAARFDGIFPILGNIETPLVPSQVRDLVAFIKSVRTSDAPFDVIQSGNTTGENPGTGSRNRFTLRGSWGNLVVRESGAMADLGGKSARENSDGSAAVVTHLYE